MVKKITNRIYWLQYKGNDEKYKTMGKTKNRPIVFSSRRYKPKHPTDALIVAVGDKVKVRNTRRRLDKRTNREYFVPNWTTAKIHKIISTKEYGLFIEVKYYEWDESRKYVGKSPKEIKKYRYVDLNARGARDVFVTGRKRLPQGKKQRLRVLPRQYLQLTAYPRRNIVRNPLGKNKTVFFYHRQDRRWLLTTVVPPYLPPPKIGILKIKP